MTNDSPHAGPPIEPTDWEGVARYLAGESTASEGAEVRRWMELHPEEARAIAELDRVTGALRFRPPSDVDVEGALRRVTEKLNLPGHQPLRPRIVRTLPARRSPWRTRGLAGLAAAAGIMAVVYVSRRSQPPGTESAGTGPVATAHTYETPVGRRDSVLLADGSRVVLGPHSRVTVPADFGRDRRAVELQGLAYFDVRHDPSRPFSVRVSDAVIDDIGTRFVAHDDADGSVSVSVTDGVVRLRPAKGTATDGLILRVGDRGVVDQSGRARAFPGGASADDLAWTRGQLVFRESPFPHVVNELRRWYGLELRAGDSALSTRRLNLTATFTTEPLDQVLKVIGLDLGARIERRGDTAIVHLLRGRSGQQ